MDQKQAIIETKYQLIKIIIATLEQEKVLNASEVEAIRKKAVQKLKPLIGSLE